MSAMEPPVEPAPATVRAAARAETTTVSTYCRLCEATCGLIAELAGPRLVRVRPNAQHAHSRGFACGKPQAMVDLTYDPDRITVPMVRTGGPGEFSPVTWHEALEACAAGLSSVRDQHGPDALAVIRGNPTFYDFAGLMWQEGFSSALGITSTYHINSEDGASRMAANEALYGDSMRLPLPDLWRTKFVLVIGANPLRSRSTRLSEPQIREAMDDVVERGGRVVVVDPYRTITAERYEHVSIRPGTDPWFLLGVCATIAELDPAGRLAERGAPVAHVEEFLALASSFDIDDCAQRCGVDADVLREVGKAFVEAESAAVYGATGTCAQRFGTLTNILQDTVLAITGNIDREGGMLGGWPSVDLLPPAPGPRSGGRSSRAEGRPDVGGLLPSAALAADITYPGQDRVRALIIYGNNSVLSSGGGGERLEEALQQLDFSVALDLYMNETNRFANVLLPVATMFERDDYPATTAGMQLRPTAYGTRAVIEPQGESKPSWWIFDELSRRMGLGGACPDKALEAAAEADGQRPTPEQVIDGLLAGGPAGDITFDDLVTQHPNGITFADFLPLGRLTAWLATPEGAVDVYSSELQGEIERLRLYVEPDEQWPLRLVGRREKNSQNTWMHNSSRIYRDSYRFSAHVHPEDAARCGAATGDDVRLVSDAGSIVLPIEVTDSVRPGVVSVPNGWGHRGGSWTRANSIAGANSNELVSPDDVEIIAGMSILNGVPIRMERLTS